MLPYSLNTLKSPLAEIREEARDETFEDRHSRDYGGDRRTSWDDALGVLSQELISREDVDKSDSDESSQQDDALHSTENSSTSIDAVDRVHPAAALLAGTVRGPLEEREANTMLMWRVNMKDPDVQGIVPITIFCAGIDQLMASKDDWKAAGIDRDDFFTKLMDLASGAGGGPKFDKVTLKALFPDAHEILQGFKDWMEGCHIESAADFFMRIDKAAVEEVVPSENVIASGEQEHIPDGALSREEFILGVKRLGYEGDASLIFGVIDDNNSGNLMPDELFFFEDFATRANNERFSLTTGFGHDLKRKEEARASRRRRISREQRLSVRELRKHLRRISGSVFRGWHSKFDHSGSMQVTRGEFYRACTQMGFNANMRLAWSELDRDKSGRVELVELDPATAILMALLKSWAAKSYPSLADCIATPGFAGPHGFITREQFCSGLAKLGFRLRAPLTKKHLHSLFHGLDKNCASYVRAQDFECVDRWMPPEWLIARPDPETLEKLKLHLLQKHKTLHKAWRAMDTSQVNRVRFLEFCAECKRSGFCQNLPGAWRALDSKLFGCIVFKTFDPETAEVLQHFSEWAYFRFGGVPQAFSVIKTNFSKGFQLRHSEFQEAIQSYNYPGNHNKLFKLLDGDENKHLSYEEFGFVDTLEGSDYDQDSEPPGHDDVDNENAVGMGSTYSSASSSNPTYSSLKFLTRSNFEYRVACATGTTFPTSSACRGMASTAPAGFNFASPLASSRASLSSRTLELELHSRALTRASSSRCASCPTLPRVSSPEITAKTTAVVSGGSTVDIYAKPLHLLSTGAYHCKRLRPRRKLVDDSWEGLPAHEVSHRLWTELEPPRSSQGGVRRQVLLQGRLVGNPHGTEMIRGSRPMKVLKRPLWSESEQWMPYRSASAGVL